MRETPARCGTLNKSDYGNYGSVITAQNMPQLPVKCTGKVVLYVTVITGKVYR
jgi:hypothetical protein